MGHKVESTHVGSRVLPICNVAAPALGSPDAGNSSDASLNKKRRAISRMKELLRRAVTTKSEKGENKPWKVQPSLNDTHPIRFSNMVNMFKLNSYNS